MPILNAINVGNASVANAPVVALRNPGLGDIIYVVGQVWINTVDDTSFVLTSFGPGGIPVWTTQGVVGGALVATSLVTTPGPISLTGTTTITGDNNVTGVITLTENSGTNGSIIIQSTQGTSDSSVEIQSVAGGIEIITSAAGKDVAIVSSLGSFVAFAGENSSTAISLNASGGTSSGIRLQNSTGTATNSIDLTSTLGGVTITGTRVSVGGSGELLNFSGLNAPGAINLTASGGVLTGILIENTSGTATNAVDINALSGGVDITGALNVSIEGQQNAPGAVSLEASGGVASTMSLTNSSGTTVGTVPSNAAIGIVSTAGGIGISAAKDVSMIVGTDIVLNTVLGDVSLLSDATDVDIEATLGNVNILSPVGTISMNNFGSAGATDIGNKTAGGLVTLESLTEIRIDPVATLSLAPTSTVSSIDIGNISPSVSRTTVVNGGAVISAITDTLSLAPGGVNTNGAASKVVNIASGNNLVGSQIVNIATGTTVSGAKTVTIGNVDGLTTINEFGAISMNVSGPGVTTIGNAVAGGAIDLTTNTADLTLSSTGGSVIATSARAANNAVQITATDPLGGVLITGSTTGNVSIARNTLAGAAGPNAAVASTLNSRVGSVTYAGYTQAAASTLVITLTNSFIAVNSLIFAQMTDVSANASAMTLNRIRTNAGSAVLTFINNGSQAVNGNLQLNFWVLS